MCNALENIDKLWLESDLDTKQRIQQLIFPNGLTYENNGFRIGQNSIFFNKKGALRYIGITQDNVENTLQQFEL